MHQEELIQHIKIHTREGYELLYDNYARNLYSVIYAVVKDDSTSEDLLQETFVKVWKNIDHYDKSKGTLYTWMLNIARNLSIDHVRSKQAKKQKKTQSMDGLDIHSALLNISSTMDNIDLRSIVGKLEPKYREVVDAIFWSGYNHDQAALHLNLPLGTVKTRARTALILLRNYL
jgi:RNA polymerase sigma-70 factor (ECF subfamily)